MLREPHNEVIEEFCGLQTKFDLQRSQFRGLERIMFGFQDSRQINTYQM